MKNENVIPELVSFKTTRIDKNSDEFYELMELYHEHNEEDIEDIEADVENLKSQFLSGLKYSLKFDNGDCRETISLNFLADTFTDDTKKEKAPHYKLFTLTGTYEHGQYFLYSQFSTCTLCFCPDGHNDEHNFDYNLN